MSDRRSGIRCRERGVNLAAAQMCFKSGNDRRCRVDDKLVAHAIAGQRLAGVVGARVAGDNFDAVMPVGQL